MTDDPIARLKAGLDADEAAADTLTFACRRPDLTPDFTACGGPAAEAFWRRFTEGRALRVVAAHRAILARHRETYAGDCAEDEQLWPCPTVLALAAIYSDDAT